MPGYSPEIARFCREVEQYLCRKNDGHLVRIVGPAFDTVSAWAARGVPLTVACRGIDRYFERYYAKGSRRRPVRVEFCEADVLDAFDEWRTAVGAVVTTGGETRADVEAAPRRRSVPTHLDRVIARLTAARGGAGRLDATLDAAVAELDAARVRARDLRGPSRDALLARLRALDAELLAVARAGLDGETRVRLEGEADTALAPYRGRMPADEYTRLRAAAVDRLVREHARLPEVAFE
jgi:hypothetical protein